MVKVNLLASAVSESASAPAPKPAQATGQILLIAVAVVGLVVGFGVDYYFTHSAADAAKKRLEDQKKVKMELEVVKKEAEEFKKKKDLVESRLAVIKKLEAGQRGPVAILNAINERIPPEISLNSIKQRGNTVTIDGVTTNKDKVTLFAKELEILSNGLFTAVDPAIDAKGSEDPTEQQTIKFTITCVYNPPQPAPPPGSTTPATTTPPK